ncbi:ankyrin repeat domain-containing protein 13D isoform X2 [Anabrus simplex]|uniref:ankyrin repeat domain-containing protein 13D isoform X2 n=1 Tax=Anabrus simplex TaxID=316456 RepID=UPI0034DCE7C9
MPSLDFIKSEYPLHWLVWNNDYKELDKELSKNVHEKEKHDTRGRTPLMLAVTLGHLESTRVLLKHASNVHAENREGWTVVQEAVSTGDPELLGMILERRDIQRYTARVGGIPDLLHKLKEAPDFYVEMKWEFASWVPLVSRLCPSDTYRVYKQGSNVRIDTTILGFDQTSWQRGNRSFIFKGQRDKTIMMEVDHEARQVYIEDIILISPDDLQFLHPSEEAVTARLTTPIVSTYVDTDKISFERNKSGIWGWRADKSENVNGYDCKVFGANNVAIVTKTRTEHLTESDKMKARPPKSPLQSFLSIAEIEETQTTTNHQNEEYSSMGNPSNITPEEYFDETVDLDGRDIGRPREINTKIQKFKATLWLCEKYPLSLPEQIMPIVDLMAISSTHFAKLKDFIQMQLPAGFPVKIEIPIFHVVNARITFGNIFGLDEDIPGVTRVQEDDRLSCIVDESCFAPPPGYTKLSAEVRRQFSYEEEDELLQFAIQQSLIEAGSERDEVDIWEALRAQRPSRPSTPNLPQIGTAEEERQLQRAIQASLALLRSNMVVVSPDAGSSTRASPDGSESTAPDVQAMSDLDLQMALALSQQDIEVEERLKKEEEEMMEQALRLSLKEK